MTVTLTGTGFVVGATTVAVSGTGVTVSAVVVSSATTLTATFTIAPEATLGPRSVTVTTSAGTSNGVVFTVTSDIVVPPPEGLLTPEDITFIGYYRFPDPNWDLYYAATGLALRSVGGDARLFTQSQDAGEKKLVEYTIPATPPAMTLAGAPRLTDLVDHGGIYDACFAGSGLLVSSDVNAVAFGGLCWDEERHGIWFTWNDPYGVAVPHYPTLGFAAFSGETLDTVYGPWRTTIHPNRTSGPVCAIPASFADANLDGARFGITMGSGSGAASRAAGCGLAAITDFDPTALAAAVPPNPAPVAEVHGQVETTWIFQHDVAHPQPRDDQYRLCFWSQPGDPGHQHYDCSLATHIETPGTDWGGNVENLINPNDSITGVVWIRTATKRGVVFFGQLTTTPAGYVPPGTDPDGLVHAWYGNPGHGTATGSGYPDGACCHGQPDPYWTSTGAGSHYNVPHMWIYDDEALIPAIAGAIDLWDVAPQSVTQLVDGSGDLMFPDVPSNQMPSAFFGACAFDPVTSRIYAIVKNVDGTQPVVAVFEVAA